MTDHWVSTAKGRLFAKRWGGDSRKAPIVLFHDSLGCVALWRSFPEQLSAATGRTVIAYDRLGFGRSDPYPSRLDFDFMGEEAGVSLPALRRHFGFDRFVALGHSVGGEMAVMTAGAYPADCEAVVTVAAQSFIEDCTRAGIREAERAFAEPGAMDRLAKYHGDKAEWVLNAWIRTWLSPDFADWTLDADLARVRCPVLAVHGADDEYGSTEQPRRIVSLVAGPSTLEIIPGCGHVPHREQEGLLIELVSRFLERNAVDTVENAEIAS